MRLFIPFVAILWAFTDQSVNTFNILLLHVCANSVACDAYIFFFSSRFHGPKNIVINMNRLAHIHDILELGETKDSKVIKNKNVSSQLPRNEEKRRWSKSCSYDICLCCACVIIALIRQHRTAEGKKISKSNRNTNQMGERKRPTRWVSENLTKITYRNNKLAHKQEGEEKKSHCTSSNHFNHFPYFLMAILFGLPIGSENCGSLLCDFIRFKSGSAGATWQFGACLMFNMSDIPIMIKRIKCVNWDKRINLNVFCL